MLYLDPADVLRRFSRFTLSTVRPAVAEDERFVHGQVGSMASTLRFLAGELEGRERAVVEQERALREALREVAAAVEEGPVAAAVAEARERLDANEETEDATATAYERERVVLAVADDVLARIDEELDGETARAARRPFYGFLETRLEAQHRMLGRRTDDSGDEGEADRGGEEA